ncbi:hypothetical protein OIO90_001797 [Microbotryomycetes sp. JL221]|nr:hypothetical protein OIO90_001797 [Microbotryomycetes sp. JL221]
MTTTQNGFAIPEATFYYDCVCPFAYIAAIARLPDIIRVTNAKVTWKPVLLGGLYKMTEAPQGKDGSATDIMPQSKLKMFQEDFQREIRRYQLSYKSNPNHPVKTVDAGRLMCAFPDEYRPLLAQALFKAYHEQGANISSRVTLLRIARSLKLTSVGAPTHAGPFSLNPALPFALDESVFSNMEYDEKLRQNTQEAFDLGAFGVPFFHIPSINKVYWGQDRLHFFEANLTAIKLRKPVEKLRNLERFHPRCLRTPPENRARHLKFWFDFSSPWAYLAWTQLERIQRDAGPGLTIELKPFLLGALFKAIGTPLVPMERTSAARNKYIKQDISDWSSYWDLVNAQEYPPIEPAQLQWPKEFPIRSVTALRVCLLDEKTVPCIYRAAWRDNKPISDENVLIQVLNEGGFNGKQLILNATSGTKSEAVKARLRANTEEAIAIGLCGAPTFQLGKTLVWGGDRINHVLDLVLGWRPEKSNLKASVAAFPHFDYRL